MTQIWTFLQNEAHVALLYVERVPHHVEVAEEGGHVVARDADVVDGAVEEVVIVQLVGGADGVGGEAVDGYGGVAVDLFQHTFTSLDFDSFVLPYCLGVGVLPNVVKKWDGDPENFIGIFVHKYFEQ